MHHPKVWFCYSFLLKPPILLSWTPLQFRDNSFQHPQHAYSHLIAFLACPISFKCRCAICTHGADHFPLFPYNSSDRPHIRVAIERPPPLHLWLIMGKNYCSLTLIGKIFEALGIWHQDTGHLSALAILLCFYDGLLALHNAKKEF